MFSNPLRQLDIRSNSTSYNWLPLKNVLKSWYGLLMGLLNMKNKSFGFTLSEIMIALALIGAVAAMTIPTVGSSVQQRARLAEFRTAHSKAELALKSIIFEDARIPQC